MEKLSVAHAWNILPKVVVYSHFGLWFFKLQKSSHYTDFPNFDEMITLLDLLDNEVIGFWYDVGHAQALGQLGFTSHEAWLRRFASQMVGVHFHDVIGIDDHQAPGLGEVDWDMVLRYLPKGMHCTVEVQPHNTPAQIMAGMEFLTEKGIL